MTLDKDIVVGVVLSVFVDVGREQLLFSERYRLHTRAFYKNVIELIDRAVKVNVAAP